MLQPSKSSTKQYQTILDVFGLQQMVKQPTRVTQHSRTLIDHIVTNYPQSISHTGIIPTTIVSDHDAIFACINVRVPRFQPRYKYIRQEESLDEDAFKEDFSSLPLHVIYGLECPDDMVDSINTLTRECIDRHAPIRRVKVTRPPAPWMQSEQIRQLQAERDRLRAETRKNVNDESGLPLGQFVTK